MKYAHTFMRSFTESFRATVTNRRLMATCMAVGFVAAVTARLLGW